MQVKDSGHASRPEDDEQTRLLGEPSVAIGHYAGFNLNKISRCKSDCLSVMRALARVLMSGEQGGVGVHYESKTC